MTSYDQHDRGTGSAGYLGDGSAATGAKLSSPTGVAVDSEGNLYIADSGNNVIRRVDALTYVITTIAGNGTAVFSGDGGLATGANLHDPKGVFVDHLGNFDGPTDAFFSVALALDSDSGGGNPDVNIKLDIR